MVLSFLRPLQGAGLSFCLDNMRAADFHHPIEEK
jgi:hypothetical protein